MKVFYEIDPFNRLVVKGSGGRSNVRRFRRVVRGRFKTDGKNRLYYEVFKSSGKQTPQKIRFSGRYSLDREHKLIYSLNKWNNQVAGNRLRLRTRFAAAGGNEIVFLLNSRTLREKGSVYTLKLHGTWQADGSNRLRFGVKKEDNKKDGLTLFNAWNVNKNNEIIYNYGPGRSRTVTFKGRWRLKDRYRLGYILDKGIKSGFDFQVMLGRLAPRKKEAYIKFDVKITISRRKTVRRNILFICKYKRAKGRSLALEVSPSRDGGRIRLKKEVLSKDAVFYLESSLKGREGYLGGGLAFRW